MRKDARCPAQPRHQPRRLARRPTALSDRRIMLPPDQHARPLRLKAATVAPDGDQPDPPGRSISQAAVYRACVRDASANACYRLLKGARTGFATAVICLFQLNASPPTQLLVCASV